MKLGLMLGYSGGELKLPVERVKRAERLGYNSIWTAEAYGSDAVTPLAYLAAVTERIKLGTAIMQVSARTPANAAMSIGTVDALAGGGRVIAGLGVSGPQIVEGWYGRPWGSPYYWLKDYVEIMRKVFRREAPVTHDGKQIQLPFTGEGALGVGKPLKSILHMNPDIPIYLGAGNEQTVRLCADLCDGWLPLGLTPGTMHEYSDWIEQGFERARQRGEDKGWHNFEVEAMVHAELDDDVQAALDRLKPEVALYVGGMGHRNKNFHKEMMIRRGFGDAAERIQELYLAGRKDEATAAVPDEWVDAKSLVGPPKRIRERFAAWEDSGATSCVIRTQQDAVVDLMAEVARLNPPRGEVALGR